MPRLSLRCGAALVGAAMLLGCGPSSSQINAMIRDAHARDMAVEKDPDARAWLEGWYQCSMGEVDTRMACYATNEEKTVASLKSQAETATAPSARQAFHHAAECIESATKMTVPEGTKPIGDYSEVKACLTEKRRTVTVAAKEQDDEYTAAEKADTTDAWFGFIEKHHEDPRVSGAAKRIVVASMKADGDARTGIEERLAEVYPAGVAELPADRRILLVGPKGLRVRDIVKLKSANVSENIVLARIKASTEPYKNFDADELAALKQLGVADNVVAAMIEVTTKVGEKKKADEDRQALHEELAALRTMIEEKKAAGGATGGQVVQTKDGPMDVLASCGKRLGAMKLCEQIPFPGSTLCQSTAESEFPCPKQ